MDLLRTSTLRIVSGALDLIEETTGEKIDIYEVERDDPEVFDLLAKGHTHGVFQLSGNGITSYTRQVRPTKQEEIIDIAALK